MNRKNFEEQITPELKWKRIKDIPNFPFNTFEDIKRHVEANQFSIGIYVGSDFKRSDELFAQLIYGGTYKKDYNFFFLLLSSTPIIVAILSFVLALVLGNYWLLIGIVLGFIGQHHSSDPSIEHFWKKISKIIASLFFLVFVYGLWQGKETITYLSAFFIFPFLVDSFSHSMKQNKLKAAAMQSEKIFIFLYQIGKLGLIDNLEGQIYCHIQE